MSEDNPERTNPTPGRSRDERVFSDDGVDLTLIRWMLSLTPAERLQVLQDNVNFILGLHGDEK